MARSSPISVERTVATVHIQNDGKLVVAGLIDLATMQTSCSPATMGMGALTPHLTAMARSSPILAAMIAGYSLALQNDGKLIVTGQVNLSGTNALGSLAITATAASILRSGQTAK